MISCRELPDLKYQSKACDLDITGGEMHPLPMKLDGKIGTSLTERQVDIIELRTCQA